MDNDTEITEVTILGFGLEKPPLDDPGRNNLKVLFYGPTGEFFDFWGVYEKHQFMVADIINLTTQVNFALNKLEALSDRIEELEN